MQNMSQSNFTIQNNQPYIYSVLIEKRVDCLYLQGLYKDNIWL